MLLLVTAVVSVVWSRGAHEDTWNPYMASVWERDGSSIQDSSISNEVRMLCCVTVHHFLLLSPALTRRIEYRNKSGRKEEEEEDRCSFRMLWANSDRVWLLHTPERSSAPGEDAAQWSHDEREMLNMKTDGGFGTMYFFSRILVNNIYWRETEPTSCRTCVHRRYKHCCQHSPKHTHTPADYLSLPMDMEVSVQSVWVCVSALWPRAG